MCAERWRLASAPAWRIAAKAPATSAITSSTVRSRRTVSAACARASRSATCRVRSAALFTLLSKMMANGAENVTVKSALVAAEFDLRTAAPDVAADLTRHVADLLDRAHAAGAVRPDLTVEEVMALVAGAFAAIRHAGAETSRKRSAHIAQIILDGLRPQSR
jgi:hypothetical protein